MTIAVRVLSRNEMEQTFLVAHARIEVLEAVSAAIAPREVRWVKDASTLLAEASAARFGGIVLEHPLLGVPATFIARSLRERNLLYPLVVMADGITDVERDKLAAALGPDTPIFSSLERFLEAITQVRDEVEAEIPGTAGIEETDEISTTSLEELEARTGGAKLALKLDLEACGRWVPLQLPPRLIALLDGSRSALELVAVVDLSEAQLVRFLEQVESAGCLELMSPAERPAARPAGASARAPWAPPEPGRPPDEEGTLARRPGVELLLQLKRDAFTGYVFVQIPVWTMRLDLAKGIPVQAGGGPPRIGFGEVLVELGYLDAGQLQDVLAARDGSRPLGDVAIRLGFVTPLQVLAALRAQVESAIRALVCEREGAYRLFRDDAPLALPFVGDKPLETLVEDALRADGATRSRLVDAFLRDNAARRVSVTERAFDMLPAFHFGGRVQRLLRQLDGRSLGEALAGSNLARDESELALYLLSAAGCLDMGAGAPRRD